MSEIIFTTILNELWCQQDGVKIATFHGEHAAEVCEKVADILNALAGIDDVQGFVDAVRSLVEQMNDRQGFYTKGVYSLAAQILAMMEGKHD